MSLPLTGVGGIFTVFGPAFAAMDALNVASGTTIPPLTKAFQDAYQEGYALQPESKQLFEIAMQSIPRGELSWQAAGSSYTGPTISALSLLLVEYVRNDTNVVGQGLEYAIRYLAADMLEQAQTVQSNAVSSAGIIADPLNGSTDVVLAYSLLDENGFLSENAYAELIRMNVAVGGRYPTISIRGDEQAGNRASHSWPMGSGNQTSITAVDASTGGSVPNPGFESSVTELPNNWFYPVGSVNSIKVTEVPVHQVVVAGDPTSGSYLLLFTNPYDGRKTYTPTIQWDATAAGVRSALATIFDLEDVAVDSVGISPNWTHVITFNGLGGSPAVMTVINQLDTGTVTPSVVTPGSQYAYQGTSVYFLGDGAELTDLQTELSIISPETTYFLTARMARNATLASGSLVIEVLDAIGAVVEDNAGNQATMTIDVTTIPANGTFYHATMAFQVTPAFSQPLYLSMRMGTALTAGGELYFDNVNIFEGTRLYPGGPAIMAVGGMIPSTVNHAWTMQVDNDYAGGFQSWFGRAFNMASYGVLLPSSGAPTIPDYV